MTIVIFAIMMFFGLYNFENKFEVNNDRWLESLHGFRTVALITYSVAATGFVL
jgi:hypothetical protein